MLFLIRTAFWLIIIVLLLPTDERQRSEIYGTAQAAVNDIVMFCDRNPETCAKGKDAFGVFVQKAQYGARMLIDLVNGRTDASAGSGDMPLSEPASEPDPETEAIFEPTGFGLGRSQDTLSPEDREEAWAGPGT
jgi:hypothetical protein